VQSGDRSLLIARLKPGRCRADDEHDLAAWRLGRVMGRELLCATTADLLVELRQLAADRDGATRVGGG
jgi:hypothetical protein